VAALKHHAFDLSFEMLVREPVRSLTALAGFCDLPADETAIERASLQISTSVLVPEPEFQGYEEPMHSS